MAARGAGDALGSAELSLSQAGGRKQGGPSQLGIAGGVWVGFFLFFLFLPSFALKSVTSSDFPPQPFVPFKPVLSYLGRLCLALHGTGSK